MNADRDILMPVQWAGLMLRNPFIAVLLLPDQHIKPFLSLLKRNYWLGGRQHEVKHRS